MTKLPSFLIFLFFPQAYAAHSQSLNVITFNIRYNNPGDGVNAWPHRKEAFIGQLKSASPDVIGLQEVLWNQLKDLKKGLKGYSYVGEGRDGGKRGEFSPVFYNRKKFTLISWKTRWLAPDSLAKGKLAWDAGCTRIYTLVELKNKITGEEFVVINTHFDHVGEEARLHSAEIILALVKKMATRRFILMGDFNCTPDSNPIMLLTKNGRLFDAALKNNSPTCCGFKMTDVHDKRIDYIFHSAYYTPVEYQILDTVYNGHFLSDHHGVFCRVELRGE